MRPIDADELKAKAFGKRGGLIHTSDIDDAPTVDAVEVVRCEYCKWGREASGNIECFADRNAPPEYHGYDWFCPNGDRRTDE